MSEISGLREQIMANYDHLGFATPASRANIIVEAVQGGYYNAVITDKVSRKRVVDCQESDRTITDALEKLLRYTCTMLGIQRDDPARWRRLTPIGQGVPEEDEQESELGSDDEELPELVDMPDETRVVPGPGQATRKRPASVADSSASDENFFAGFTRLPRTLGRKRTRIERLPSVGDAAFAAFACASLPPGINGSAKKLLYELITMPRDPNCPGVLLSDITDNTGIEGHTLLASAKVLEKIGKAYRVDASGSAWIPNGMPDPGTSPIVSRFLSANRESYS